MLRGVFGPSKTQLIRQMRSADNRIALQAIEKLKANGWFRDGSLQGVELGGANLRGAALARANLEGAMLQRANLSRAYLGETNLRAADMQKVVLRDANLREAVLLAANLDGADLTGAYLAVSDLREANLSRVILQAANLWQARLHGATLALADLRDANLYGTEFDTKTILPDGTGWTLETNMQLFTDPTHISTAAHLAKSNRFQIISPFLLPNFWRILALSSVLGCEITTEARDGNTTRLFQQVPRVGRRVQGRNRAGPLSRADRGSSAMSTITRD